MAHRVNDIGTPLVYHPPTQTIIAYVKAVELPQRGRLFFRRVHDTAYQPIGPFPDQISIESFIVDPSRPSLYFTTTEWKSRPGGKAFGGDWEALYRFDLGEHRCETLIRRGELPLPRGCERAWLRSILALEPDGSTIYCGVGFEPTEGRPQGGHAEYREVEYWLCGFDVASRELTQLTRWELGRFPERV